MLPQLSPVLVLVSLILSQLEQALYSTAIGAGISHSPLTPKQGFEFETTVLVVSKGSS